MNISLPDPMRQYVQDRIDHGHYATVSDYVRDLIRRDQSDIDDETHWLRELDSSVAKSVAEMNAGGGADLDETCDTLLAEIESIDGATRR